LLACKNTVPDVERIVDGLDGAFKELSKAADEASGVNKQTKQVAPKTAPKAAPKATSKAAAKASPKPSKPKTKRPAARTSPT
ncbi:MAG: hypothetical protein ACLGHT_04040, partial [Acidimicrobiia bacterium]